MFWEEYFAIEDLMDDPDLTIQKILDSDHCLQICRESDLRLIALLSREENIDFIVNLISTPRHVSEELDVTLYRYPSLACEILTSGIEVLVDGILQTETDATVQSSADTGKQSSTEALNGLLTGATPAPAPEVSLSMSNGDRVAHSAETNTTGEKPLAHDTPSEILSSDADNSTLPRRPRLDRLLRAVGAPLNALSASFLSRVLIHLALKRGSIVIPYMRSFPNFLQHVLDHFDLTAMVDLVLQLAQQDRDLQSLVLEWFIEDQLISRLIDRFDPAFSKEVHEAVAHCLIQFITLLRACIAEKTSSSSKPPAASGQTDDVADSNAALDTGLPANNPYAIIMMNGDNSAASKSAARLLDILESEDTMQMLFSRLTRNPDSTSSVEINCLAVLVALIDRRNLDSQRTDANRGGSAQWDQWLDGGGFHAAANLSAPFAGQEASGGASGGGGKLPAADKLRLVRTHANLVKTSIQFMANLHALLQRPHPQEYNRMPTTVGILDPPLGRLRLQLAQFFAVWIDLSDNGTVAEAILNEGLVKTLMDLFEQYPFNTLLHHAVAHFIRSIFMHAKVIAKCSWLAKPEDDRQAADTEPLPSSDSDRNRSTADEDSMDVDPDQALGNPGDAAAAAAATNPDTPSSSALLFPKSPGWSAPWDKLFTALFTEYRITDWCLRLSPLPEKLSLPSDTAILWHSKTHPKPGHAGHLWRLANLIERARNGLRLGFVEDVFNQLPATSVSAWDAFCSDHLAKINQFQVADNVPDSNPHLPVEFKQFLSQPDDSLNFPSSLGNAGKFSLYVCGRPSFRSVIRTTTDLVDLNIDPNLPAAPTDDTTSQLAFPHASSLSLTVASHDALLKEDFSSMLERMANESDEAVGSPILEDHERDASAATRAEEEEDEEEDDEEDDEEEEEEEEEEDELHSPMVIKQQRAAALPRTEPIIGLNQFAPTQLLQANPWQSIPDSSGINNSPTGWAQFDDGAAQANDNATAWPSVMTRTDVADDHQHLPNGLPVDNGCSTTTTTRLEEPSSDLGAQTSEERRRSSDSGKASPPKSPLLTSGEIS